MKRERFKFEKLEVYQRALRLVERVYLLTKRWPKEYLYDLISQFRRAALSILLNIAEGSGRSKREFGRYLDIAVGSGKECVALIDLAAHLGLLTDKERENLYNELTEVILMLGGLTI